MRSVRVLGSSLARIADAMVSTFIANVGAPSLDEDPSGLALARANVGARTLEGFDEPVELFRLDRPS